MKQLAMWVMVAVSFVVAAAQQPKVTNAQVSVREGAGLQSSIAATQSTTWIGYSVPVVHGVHSGWDESVVYLEGGRHDTAAPERKPGEPAPRANFYLRVAAGKVEKLRIEEPGREIDGGGLPFVWLGELKPVESIAVLSRLVEGAAKVVPEGARGQEHEFAVARSLLETSILGIAVEDAPEVTPVLAKFTAATYALTVRDRAAFWLANERGHSGFEVVSRLLREDKDDAFRRKLVFDLSLTKGDEAKAAVDVLLSVAKADRSPQVQSQAQFWLAQMAGKKLGDDPRIARALGSSAENDPAMTKSAVFALSRLPADQGVPELIRVAGVASSLTTRREAIFWLGQSKDARALAYIEKVARGQ